MNTTSALVEISSKTDIKIVACSMTFFFYFCFLIKEAELDLSSYRLFHCLLYKQSGNWLPTSSVITGLLKNSLSSRLSAVYLFKSVLASQIFILCSSGSIATS